ncbi:MAG TPA: FKBP-type peptidyl-prolyl cis-trans isomerase [Thermoanaerobaculia bacterium]|nr:FKBP-type peptidyl-prolyl cis-trans isomerase [Thermoanaerobaculia bacterium]
MFRRSLILATLALPLFAADKPVPPADLATPPADAQKAENGLITRQLAKGNGTVMPNEGHMVRLRYTVWKQDGTLVQHIAAPQSVLLPIQKMIPGWRQAVEMMVVGEQRRAWIPAELSGAKANAPLLIDTELVELLDRPTTPPDVAAAPADAKTTESGLAYKVLRAGTGTVHPKRRDSVSVHYSGWTTDGHMFDSSIMHGGEPVEFPLEGVIRGWTEGLQLMVEGEKTRFWIPAKLAYGNEKGKPQGMLVFDIELLKID